MWRRGRCLAVVKGALALALCKRGLVWCVYTGRSMCDCCAYPLWLFARCWQRRIKLLTGREAGDTDHAGERYGRIPPFDEEAQLDHDRNNAFIAVQQQLQDKEQQLTKVEQQLSTVEREKSNAVHRASDLAQQLKTAEQAKDEALSRLSEQVALKLADNNPNIADLSDMNRPTILAEKFSTLYDDQWTDAFDAVSGYPGFEEEVKIIKILLEIVQDCFKLCREEAYKQLQQVLAAYNTTVEAAPRELIKMTKDTRKKHASVYLPALKQTVFNSSSAKYGNIIQDEAVQAYVNRCTELCWLMSVQDPPMALYSGVAPDYKYDKTKYREYMKSGDYVDYIVWPCVLIQDGGNLMSKGVAQGRVQPNAEMLVTID